MTRQRFRRALKRLCDHILRRPQREQAHSVKAVAAHVHITAEHVPFAHKQPVKPLHFLHLVRWLSMCKSPCPVVEQASANPFLPDRAIHAPVSKKFPSAIEHIQTIPLCQSGEVKAGAKGECLDMPDVRVLSFHAALPVRERRRLLHVELADSRRSRSTRTGLRAAMASGACAPFRS